MGKIWSDHEVERMLRKAVDRSVPNVYDQVSSGVVPPLLNADNIVPTPTRRRVRRLPLALCACALVALCIGAWSYFDTAAILSIGTAPDVELSLNRYQRVLSARGSSEVGEEILTGLTLKHSELDDALDDVIDAMERLDYLNQAESIPIAVDGGDWKYNRTLLNLAEDALEEAVRESGGQAQIIPATEESDAPAPTVPLVVVSAPPVAPTSKVTAPPAVLPSHNQEQTGKESGGGKNSDAITAAQAEGYAFAHAGYTADQVKNRKTELEEDDGQYFYEVEFEYGELEYQYHIDAQTGAVLALEVDD